MLLAYSFMYEDTILLYRTRGVFGHLRENETNLTFFKAIFLLSRSLDIHSAILSSPLCFIMSA